MHDMHNGCLGPVMSELLHIHSREVEYYICPRGDGKQGHLTKVLLILVAVPVSNILVYLSKTA